VKCKHGNSYDTLIYIFKDIENVACTVHSVVVVILKNTGVAFVYE
jgi:hypothetical protein